MTPTEVRYAQIEKEALALTWACEKFGDYLVGLKFHIFTDHKPLVPLLSTKRLDELPLRVQRFRLRLMRYYFTISHVPGKDMTIPDALSRAPSTEATLNEKGFQDEVNAYVNVAIKNLPASQRRIQQIRKHQEEDAVLRQVSKFCYCGWPDTKNIPNEIKPYHSVSSELSVEKGLLLRGSRIVIPHSLQAGILAQVHRGHQGITKCRERARQCVWWPGLSAQLEEVVRRCRTCCKEQLQRSEPLMESSLPSLPWQKIAIDLFDWQNSAYLIIVDYYSRFIEVAKLHRTTAHEVIEQIKVIFARHGVPEEVMSDNGPQFASSQFQNFSRDYGFDHITSSPLYPQSNGEAERAVKTVKGLWKKNEDPLYSLLIYNATPLQLGYSPAELLMSRKLRTNLPMIQTQRLPRVPNFHKVEQRDKEAKQRQKWNFNAHHGARPLPTLLTGDKVWVTDRKEEGIVMEEIFPRSYVVNTHSGTFRRNRKYLYMLTMQSRLCNQAVMACPSKGIC